MWCLWYKMVHYNASSYWSLSKTRKECFDFQSVANFVRDISSKNQWPKQSFKIANMNRESKSQLLSHSLSLSISLSPESNWSLTSPTKHKEFNPHQKRMSDWPYDNCNKNHGLKKKVQRWQHETIQSSNTKSIHLPIHCYMPKSIF